jgi:uncharacterized Zn-binding protein involved in type VI secretion
MSISVAVEPPTTPVTEGSDDMATCTGPNMCKMPGPPAPFVPTHFPNIGRSADKLTDGTSTVLIEGKKIAIKGAYYYSSASPDVASKGTGGGVVSSQTEGKTEFVAPGAMTVKAEGKAIQLLGDAMTNNGGSPANSICAKNVQAVINATGLTLEELKVICQAFCQAQQEYTDGKKVARGKGAVTSRFQQLLKEAEDAGKIAKGLCQAEGWMFKAASSAAYRVLTPTALRALAFGGGMGAVVGTATQASYIELLWQAGRIPDLFRPDVIATVAGSAIVLEAKFFWDVMKDKLTPAQIKAAANMKGKFVQMKPDGSSGSPCQCKKSAIPKAHR